jgi:molybdopterin/thiamine biosynthesis adenylyltransferase
VTTADNNDTTERYKRHLLLREIGGAGQQKISKARVLIVGLGGLGAPVAQYLVAAGIGEVGLMDHDHVSLANLQRQILFAEDDLDKAKVTASADRLQSLRRDVKLNLYAEAFTGTHTDLLQHYDIIADCLDNFASRFILSDACYHAHKPLVSAAAIGFKGQLATFMPYQRDANGDPHPSYRCLVPETVATDEDCESYGVLGPITGVMGSLQALEIIKLITGAGSSLVGKVLIFDGLKGESRVVGLPWDPHNPLTGNPMQE